MHSRQGIFVISLDFELHWGVRDKKSVDDYRNNLLGARKAIPALLEIFAAHDIHATWATVGFLFFDTREELVRHLPGKRPDYVNASLTPYESIRELGANEQEDPYHFGRSLVGLISTYPNQEIGTHTFSHYYCLEKGQDTETFQADTEAATDAAKLLGFELRSLVFPRNQLNRDYLSICRDAGILAYRGNQPGLAHNARSLEDQSLFWRGLRLLDSYIPISGHNCCSPDSIGPESPVDIPASQFLRPYSHRLRYLDPMRSWRIRSGLTHAAQEGSIYHLWWHPHNFGADLNENLAFLHKILDHFTQLKESHDMVSLNMGEVARSALGESYEEE
ncbi:MAG: polysaccharide deacetylase family protein [Armatimonadota bacterium]